MLGLSIISLDRKLWQFRLLPKVIVLYKHVLIKFVLISVFSKICSIAYKIESKYMTDQFSIFS